MVNYVDLDQALAIWGRVVQSIVSLTTSLRQVVQSIVSLTTSLRRQLVKYMWTTLSNTLLFFFFWGGGGGCNSKDSHIFPTKNNSVFVIFTF